MAEFLIYVSESWQNRKPALLGLPKLDITIYIYIFSTLLKRPICHRSKPIVRNGCVTFIDLRFFSIFEITNTNSFGGSWKVGHDVPSWKVGSFTENERTAMNVRRVYLRARPTSNTRIEVTGNVGSSAAKRNLTNYRTVGSM